MSDSTTSLDSLCQEYGYSFTIDTYQDAGRSWTLRHNGVAVKFGIHYGCLGNCQDHIESALHDHRKRSHFGFASSEDLERAGF